MKIRIKKSTLIDFCKFVCFAVVAYALVGLFELLCNDPFIRLEIGAVFAFAVSALYLLSRRF